MGFKSALRERALREGFSDIRICRPDAAPELADRLAAFLKAGFHGQMRWMSERTAWRADPRALWPEIKSVVMLAENYAPRTDAMRMLARKECGNISVYARNRDYHELVKKRLKRLGRWLIAQNPGSEIKVFVDTGPVMEKPLGQAAGLGWQGKHTNLVSRRLGSWFFLGAIFTTLDLREDAPGKEHCGGCTRCLDICPTDAFLRPYQLDARRCISYLTIEHDGPVDMALRPLLGNRIYGCDDCLAVCPWNKFATAAREIGYHGRNSLKVPRLDMLAGLDDTGFRALFTKSPIKRIGRNRFIRNVLYAIGNSGEPHLSRAARKLVSDPDATVRDAARWATRRIEK